jgi:hypothetical protein
MNRITRRLMIPARLIRAARGAVIAIALAVMVATPAAAAGPTRVVHGLSGFTYPAGAACSFDVGGDPTGGFVATTTFSDGTVLRSVRARGAYVNLETGARYPTLDSYRDRSYFDPATGIQVGVESGKTTWSFLPGDVGPFGIVQVAALYHFDGSLSYVWDDNVGHTTLFAHKGKITDVCAALS